MADTISSLIPGDPIITIDVDTVITGPPLQSCLELNVIKTKEMFVDFSRHQAGRTAAIIHGEPVDAVHQYKYLGTVMKNFDSRRTPRSSLRSASSVNTS
ncbi:hypothetical protein SKAU_G00279950 [Synaphobranchus kaupii]|uniref:Uncharacterized protein n=1 Tax=Synaphobranchus kaupii TaxID=118154 RepID=A0A9Q1EWU9_SYNKA|nr:hypothetical protein SKAU_G00279950 [Synaphobranchus kaupii]